MLKRIALAILASVAVVLVPDMASAEVIPSPSDTAVATASPSPAAAPVTAPVAAAEPTPYPGGYSPGDTGNWSDMPAWFAALITAAFLGPLAWLSLMRWVRPVLFDV